MAGAPAKEVAAAAAKKGIKLSANFVHVVRSNDKARARKGKPLGRGRKGGRQRSGAPEAELRRAIAELGLARARQVLADVEAAFR